MRSPVLAIGWEIWTRNRVAFLLIPVLVGIGTPLTSWLNRGEGWNGLATAIAYALTAIALILALASFHFTEGSKRGGFGSFPRRLFTLPASSRFLVGLPMIFGAGAIVLVYLLCARILLAGIGKDLPLLWPSLYLVFGLTQFQMILWSLPESRYGKLFCLGVAASVVTFGWMFFVPEIVVGALAVWGYAGSPETFMKRLLTGLAFAGPAAYLLSLHRVRQQRHGVTNTSARATLFNAKLFRNLLHRQKPFASSDHALFWLEWRRTGFLLPIATTLILLLTCVPAGLSGGMSGRGTVGVLGWLFLSPFLLALIIGRGMGKPDFWSTGLKVAPFQAIRPVSSGQWVAAKLKVAFASTALTWLLVVYLGFLWTTLAGEPSGLQVWLSRIRFYYTPGERALLLILAPIVMITITWRLLIASLAVGLSGRKLWYHSVNLLVALAVISAFVLTIRQTDSAERQLYLYQFWPAITWLPLILTLAVVTKMALAVMAWNGALNRGWIPAGICLGYWAAWLLGVAFVALFCFLLCRNTHWMRHLFLLISILAVPLAGPALAMRSLTFNRSNP